MKFGKAVTALLWVAALALLVENISLVGQNRGLRDVAAPQIKSGKQLRMLSGVGLDGRAETLDLPTADSKLLIVTFSPGCPACQANQEGWAKLASMLKPKGVRVLWVSRDPIEVTRDYCLKQGIPLTDAVADPPYRTYLQLGLSRVPNTLLVGPGGIVEMVWAGRLDQPGWNRISEYFGGGQKGTSAAPNVVSSNAAACRLESFNPSSQACN